MSNITGDEGSFSSGNTGEEVQQRIREKQQQNLLNHVHGSSASGPSGATNSNGSSSQQQQQPPKKKRNLPGTPGKFNHSSIYIYIANLY